MTTQDYFLNLKKKKNKKVVYQQPNLHFIPLLVWQVHQLRFKRILLKQKTAFLHLPSFSCLFASLLFIFLSLFISHIYSQFSELYFFFWPLDKYWQIMWWNSTIHPYLSTPLILLQYSDIVVISFNVYFWIRENTPNVIYLLFRKNRIKE